MTKIGIMLLLAGAICAPVQHAQAAWELGSAFYMDKAGECEAHFRYRDKVIADARAQGLQPGVIASLERTMKASDETCMRWMERQRDMYKFAADQQERLNQQRPRD
ncbi:hypothetical protein QTI05_24050 [Variovorax sp. J22R193]|uniref:hypothetical protein n=1 Tax=Variovorax fucosicus TaxID=3053517 RepID=UPI00257523CC|nr:hypothetical protein [Variovorax sp. J22R193]MDM0042132.1 hypothetical protein [Variovorax sp. J22R193]